MLLNIFLYIFKNSLRISCNVGWSYSPTLFTLTPPRSAHLPTTQIHVLFDVVLNNLLCLLCTAHTLLCTRPTHPGPTLNHSLILSISCSQLLSEGLGLMSSPSVSARMPTGLLLYRSCAGYHSCYELMSTEVLSCPKVLFNNWLLKSFCPWALEGWVSRYLICGKYSTDTFSMHFGNDLLLATQSSGPRQMSFEWKLRYCHRCPPKLQLRSQWSRIIC